MKLVKKLQRLVEAGKGVQSHEENIATLKRVLAKFNPQEVEWDDANRGYSVVFWGVQPDKRKMMVTSIERMTGKEGFNSGGSGYSKLRADDKGDGLLTMVFRGGKKLREGSDGIDLLQNAVDALVDKNWGAERAKAYVEDRGFEIRITVQLVDKQGKVDSKVSPDHKEEMRAVAAELVDELDRNQTLGHPRFEVESVAPYQLVLTSPGK